ncbi:SIR2 family protein [Ciceribacter thiooxidans]|uniref:SIR2 family protein n=1 Tax=Ciceribacter thiooxidans TaxID=1969821 RepID=A0ABV7I2S7_9HYPH|nr:SIR2 family protein [Ciceribacter thiooxidans]
MEEEADAPLTDLADFCERSITLKESLIGLLLSKLTLCTPSPYQKKMMSLPWRAVFTTNFDDVAERAIEGEKTVITPQAEVKRLQAGKKVIYYLHGRAKDIIEGSVDPSLVISETNYLDLKTRNRDLYSALVNEVHAASRIFFVGYSVRDAEIASRLFSIPSLHQKSIVICGPAEKKVAINRLEKFGRVFPIGVEGFVDALPSLSEIIQRKSEEDVLSYVKRVVPVAAKNEIESSDIESLLLAGLFNYGAYAAQEHSQDADSSYCIKRSDSLNILFSLDNVNRFVISSDLGNGKSIFLEQAIFKAHGLGYEVFKVDTQLPEALTELDALLQSEKKRLYIVDGLVRYQKVVRHIGKRLPGNCILLVSSGQFLDELAYSELNDQLGGVTREIDLNILTASELSAWDSFLERWGFWETRIEEAPEERIHFLRERCGCENRAIVLSLFRNSNLAQKIESIVSFFLNNNRQYTRAFVAVLINSLCQRHVDWSRIVGWLDIYEAGFRRQVLASPVRDFMAGSKRWYEFTSTELADHILNSYDLLVDDIVDVYTMIVRETAYAANDPRSGFDSRENLKELMRFRFLTRLFSKQANGVSSINAVYQRLSTVPRIRNNDQFWLQYAMARMEVNDLDNSEIYLGTAIGLANKKGMEYSKRQIHDQQARLLFRKNKLKLKESEISKAIELLTDLLLERSVPVVHPLRSVTHLLAFLEAKADELRPALVVELRNLIKLMREKVPEGRLDKSQKGETEYIRRSLRDCALIVGNL